MLLGVEGCCLECKVERVSVWGVELGRHQVAAIVCTPIGFRVWGVGLFWARYVKR